MSSTSEQQRIGYEPQDKQVIAHSAPADEVLYGGAAGGGKSEWLINDAIQSAINWPGSRGVLFRRTFSELRFFVDRSRVLIPKGAATWNEQDHRWTFANEGDGHGPSYLTFSHLQHDDDIHKHQGEEYDWIGFDEWTHFTHKQTDYLRTRNRTSLPGGWPRLRGASNPGNVGHKYLRDTFVRPNVQDAELLFWYDGDRQKWLPFPRGTRGKPMPYIVWRPDPTEEMVEEGIEQRSRCFIPARVDDNAYIAKSYKANLLAQPDQIKQALLYGNWDDFEGQFFDVFDPNIHVIDPMVPEGKNWRIVRGLDWGWSDPLVCLWAAQNQDTKQIVIFKELYQSNLADSEAARLIHSITGDLWVDYTVADRMMFRGNSNDSALSLDEVYRNNGILLQMANHDRVSGWSRIRDLLSINPETNEPGLVFTRNCYHTIESLPTLVHDENNPHDINQRGGVDDHCADALRYIVQSRGTVMTKRKTPVRAGVYRR